MSAPDWARVRADLDAGIDALGAPVGARARGQLVGYLRALADWNATYNLSGIKTVDAMVVRHLLDCLAIVAAVDDAAVADVGSGAGLPGAVLAIARPEAAVTLIEANRKKTAFLRHVKRELGLDGVRVVQVRVEAWQPETAFDAVICRAFATMPTAIGAAGHVLAEGGRFWFMKGQQPIDELAALPPGYRHVETRALTVPGLDAQRHLCVVRRDR